MRATTTLVLLFLVPCLGACNLDIQLGDLPDPDDEEPGAQCAPDAGSGPPPVLTLVGPATQSHECATAYTDPGATASDVCFGDLTRAITRAGEVDTHAPGSYPLTYNVSNPVGQSATPVTRTVNVQDTRPPVVTPSGPSNVALECGSPYTDPGAAASDECAGALPAVPTSLPDPNTPGSYSLRYQATDPSGNVALSTTERTVTVADTLAPALALVGPTNATHECGSTYVDPGATATDQCAGDLTGAVVATQTGDPNLPGTMTLNYSVTDPAGHTTVAAQPRVVNVTDTLPPVLALVGSASQAQECARPYTDPGATAMDGCFGDVSSRITRAGTLDTSVLGSYSLTYNVTDPAGQGATPVNRTVNVQDTRPPVVTPSGPSNVALECGSPYTDPGATASDECAGALPAVPSSLPDSSTPGSYSLLYRATDPSGNTALSSTARTVTVADTLPPNITVNGPLDQQFECGGTYVDPGATATDVCAGTVLVTSTRNGNSTTPGQFTITYSATDPNGNTVTSPVTRTVHVNDNAPPTLVMVGPATQVQECARPYNDLGAMANDDCFGDLTSDIVLSGSVNTGTLGSYLLTYNVTDPAGHSAAPLQRTVLVEDHLPPVVTPVGPAIVTLECGDSYTDPGATASDECAGDLPAVSTGAPDPGTVGDYSISYQATDPSGNAGISSVPRTVMVRDTLPPTIVVNPPLDMAHECGAPFVDPGVSATDVCAAEAVMIGEVWIGGPNSPGDWEITYVAGDPSGNSGVSPDTRTVHVSDNQPPVLTLLGPNPQVQECGQPYNDPGVTAMDMCFGDLSHSITRTGAVDSSVLGSYFLNYGVGDPAGHSATITRMVNVQDSLSPASFTLMGPTFIAMECGDSYTDPGAIANDACAGDLPAVHLGAPDPSTPGSYSFGYKATDPSGNTGTSSVLRTVTVSDTLPPTITVNPPLDMTHECGAPFVDPGASATDICAGDLTGEIVVAGSGSPNTPGPMTMYYAVVDPAGNNTVTAQPRIVHVTDTLRPDILMLPGPSVIACNGPPYVDPGATAVDQCEGDLTQEINVTGSVDHTRSGEYTITYDVTDFSGNTTVATRPITVGPCPICISLALSDVNLLLLEDSGAVHSVEGRVEVGGERVADRFVELRVLSSRLSRLTAHGETTREGSGVLSLKGMDPEWNVFEVEAQALTRETQLSIDAPAGSLVVLNVHGDAVVLEGLRPTLSGGIDSQDVLYNFVDAKSIRAEGAELEGTMLAPYARIDFNDGSWKGGLYAVSLTGNAQGYLSRLRDRTLCP